MLVFSYLELSATVCSGCRLSSAPKEAFINPSFVHANNVYFCMDRPLVFLTFAVTFKKPLVWRNFCIRPFGLYF